MQTRKALIAIACAALCLTPIAAETTPSSHREATVSFLEVMETERNMKLGADLMIDAQIQANPILGPYKDVLQDWTAQYISWDALGEQLVALYMNAFSESELLELTEFYRTETGQKALRTLPEIMQQAAQLGTAAAETHAPELEQMIKERASEMQPSTEKP